MKETTPAFRIRKAHRALASGRMLLQAGDIDGACNRAYYAMFYAAHAALDVERAIGPAVVIKTHHGLIAIFSRELVLTGKADKALGRALSKVYDMRLLADYEGDPLEEKDAIWAIEQAQTFVDAIATMFFGPSRPTPSQ